VRATAVGGHLQRPHEGQLHLALRQDGRRTVLQECYFQVPLQVLRPLYLDDVGTAYLYIVSPCGGVLGGDMYHITVQVETGARVCLTTPSATRIYATPGEPAQQRLAMTLQAGAVLEYLPAQTIPYAQAAFQQQLHVQLGAGACVMLQEIIAPGRQARGEVFAYRAYDSRVCITDSAGHRLLRERLRLQPGAQQVVGLGLFEDYTYLGTFYALIEGTALSAELVEHVHTLLASQSGILGSATQLAHGGLAVRVLGAEHTPVQEALHAVWDTVRQAILGYPAVVWRT